jgi:hypothetical protein
MRSPSSPPDLRLLQPALASNCRAATISRHPRHDNAIAWRRHDIAGADTLFQGHWNRVFQTRQALSPSSAKCQCCPTVGAPSGVAVGGVGGDGRLLTLRCRICLRYSTPPTWRTLADWLGQVSRWRRRRRRRRGDLLENLRRSLRRAATLWERAATEEIALAPART